MDDVCTLATTQASLDQRMARAEAAIEHSHAMLLQIMSHLGLPPEPTQTTRDQSVAAASLDIVTPRNLYRYKLRKIIMIGIFIGTRYENNNDN